MSIKLKSVLSAFLLGISGLFFLSGCNSKSSVNQMDVDILGVHVFDSPETVLNHLKTTNLVFEEQSKHSIHVKSEFAQDGMPFDWAMIFFSYGKDGGVEMAYAHRYFYKYGNPDAYKEALTYYLKVTNVYKQKYSDFLVEPDQKTKDRFNIEYEEWTYFTDGNIEFYITLAHQDEDADMTALLRDEEFSEQWSVQLTIADSHMGYSEIDN